MENLESKLKQLNAVTPEKEFVVETKNRILGTEGGLSVNWSFVANRAFLFIPALLVISLFIGWNFYTYNVRYPRVSSADLANLEMASRDLQEVEKELVKARQEVERIEDVAQALEIKEELVSTVREAEKLAQTSREVAETPRSSRSDAEVFTIMSGVSHSAESIERAAKELEESYITRQKEIALEQIEELEEKSLTAEQEADLQEAKDWYNKGEFEQALQTVLEIQSYSY